jgi:hypothetical protein
MTFRAVWSLPLLCPLLLLAACAQTGAISAPERPLLVDIAAASSGAAGSGAPSEGSSRASIPGRGGQDHEDVLGAEEASVEGRRPRIPEPMVFDLVRPLGARPGEIEVNVLVLAPLDRKRTSAGDQDPLGMVTRSEDSQGIEWAPEIEAALFDDFAVEFELPFEDSRLEAYKFASQWTIGTAFDDRYVHGVQGIVQHDRDPGVWTASLLYLGGYEFDEHWSTLAMLGARTEFASDLPKERTELLFNASVFRHVGPHSTLGLETNLAYDVRGGATALIMPQLHWEPTDQMMLQIGVGARFDADDVLPELGMRLIHTW